MDALLSVKELVSGYGKLRVLQGVSMDVVAGGITAIIGPNGHGKSTLLRTIAGLNPAWSGTVRFNGAKISPTVRLTAHARGSGLFHRETSCSRA